MKKFVFLFTLLITQLVSQAQYVTIPDAGFRSFLMQQYPSCFNGQQQMDTTCSSVVNEMTLDLIGSNLVSPNLSGVEYFDNLYYLKCSFLGVTQISKLPASLKGFWCQQSALTSLPILPNELEIMLIDGNAFALTALPPLPDSLRMLGCGGIGLSQVPTTLPSKLEWWQCRNNLISKLPPLPNNLQWLDCSNNSLLNCLPYLPNSLTSFQFDTAYISCVPNIPTGLAGFTYPICTNPNAVCSNKPLLDAKVFFDANQNNLYDGNDALLSNYPIHNSTNGFNALSNAQYGFFLPLDSGVQNIITINPPYPNSQTITPVNQSITPTIGSGIITGNYDFAVQLIPNVEDLEISMVCGIARPGFTHSVWLTAKNIGSVPITNAEVVLSYPNNWSANSATPAFTSSLNSNLTWANLSLNPFEVQTFVVSVTVPSTEPLGTFYSYGASILPNLNDINNYNNSFAWNDTVQGAYDPNDKQVSRTQLVIPYDANEELFYTIRFQNTGTDTAFNVVIRDELDASKLDINSLRVISSSHSCNAEFSAPEIVNFVFANIMLQDSFANEPESHGFVQFAIKPKPNMPVDTEISNHADIFFDFNAPIRTNDALTKVVFSVSNELVAEKVAFRVYPNPTQTGQITLQYDAQAAPLTVILYDILGKKLNSLELTGKGETQYQLPTPASGIYMYQVWQNGKRVSSGKVVKE
ncbi:MAG: T9SS type A sorting domain-containing protein [Bacteroidia bacterium]